MAHEPPAEPAPPDTAVPARDRREVPRFGFPVHRPLMIAARPSLPPSIVGVRDFSTKGAGLVCDQAVEPGAALTLKWPHGAWQDWRLLPARVVRLTPLPSGGYVVGCLFADRLPQEDLEAFLRYGQERDRPHDGGVS
jgi:hypothetical protein